MTSLRESKILLAVAGGIAAYKSLELVRALRKEGARVTVAMTEAAQRFVSALSAESLSGQKVHAELFKLGAESEMGHIELSRAADLVVVAPATADVLAKLAHGLADDLVSTLLLATDKRVLVAPAMNVRMWLHPATRANVAILRDRGVLLVGPGDGEMACGEFGPGRMAEVADIVTAIAEALANGAPDPANLRAASPTAAGPEGAKSERAKSEGAKSEGAKSEGLAGRRIVVTSGPTFEPIDPVRYIANRSSGRQGHAIAAAAALAGAKVVLISGPVSISDPVGVEVRRVETAAQMLAAVEALLPADVFVGAAAVADWRPKDVGPSKLKKTTLVPPSLEFVENPDILATVAKAGARRPALVVGFAAETDDLLAHAQDKLARKGCDLVVANDVGPGTGVMGGPANAVHLVSRGAVETWPRLAKEEVARRLVLRFAEMLRPGGEK